MGDFPQLVTAVVVGGGTEQRGGNAEVGFILKLSGDERGVYVHGGHHCQPCAAIFLPVVHQLTLNHPPLVVPDAVDECRGKNIFLHLLCMR